MKEDQPRPDTASVAILVKAAPQVSTKYGETVCCAGIDAYGDWVRLYPVAFRSLESSQKFGRWSIVEYPWQAPRTDKRMESRRIDQSQLKVTGELKRGHRESYLSRAIVDGVKGVQENGGSLALLRPEISAFEIQKRSKSELDEQTDKFANSVKQVDMFFKTPAKPFVPCPYKFLYRYRSADGDRLGTCQDWEMEGTFYKWRSLYGEQSALDKMSDRFGSEYLDGSTFFAMGTHSRWPETWLINGVVRIPQTGQTSLL
ncbi:MAG: hypothetical protein AAF141_02720 [Pseudomonadota bacterium]